MASHSSISNQLEAVAQALDMPQELYELAVARYQDVGAWMAEKDKELNRRDPEVYPQGSFRLGTIVRPIGHGGEFDIDLVYHRDLQKTRTTQEQLKKGAGKHLEDYVEDRKATEDAVTALTSGRRCWTLEYESDQFHMDILPAISDEDGNVNALLITDEELTNWQKSNPVGYANWFWDQMSKEVEEQKLVLAEAAHASVEEVPDWKVKTQLQRAVQLLKRHRDIRHIGEPSNRPISIIITTLAARSYKPQTTLFDALRVIVRDMPAHIEERDGKFWVANPVNEDENFADKWESNPSRKDQFFQWLEVLSNDFAELEDSMPGSVLKKAVSEQFGINAANLLDDSQNAPLLALASTDPHKLIDEDVPGPTDTSHRKAPPWQMRLTNKIKINAGAMVGCMALSGCGLFGAFLQTKVWRSNLQLRLMFRSLTKSFGRL